MLALVQQTYYWPQMGEDVEAFVHSSHICQQDKADQLKMKGLLQPLIFPTRQWGSVSMDYISGLPKVGTWATLL